MIGHQLCANGDAVLSTGLDLFPSSPAPSIETMDRADRVAAAVDWFMANFEDPAESTPYDSREGGYQWIWGGPYDAREEVEGAFDLTDDELDEVVDEIQSDGLTEWAPNTNRIREEDTRDEEPTREDLRGLLSELRGEIGALRELHAELRSRPVGIGHNGPPDDDEGLVPSGADLDRAEEAVTDVESQLQTVRVDRELLARARATFDEIGARVRAWLAKLPAWIVEGGIKGASGTLAGLAIKQAVETHPAQFAKLIEMMSWMVGQVF